MNDAGIAHTAIPEKTLRLATATAIAIAVDVYKSKSLLPLTPLSGDTSYRSRQLRDVQREMVDKNVLLEAEDRVELQPLDMESDRSKASVRVNVPTKFDYSRLNLTELRTFIACCALARYSRTPFRITVTHEVLAERAGVSLRGIGEALNGLQSAHLLKSKKVWRKGTEITLTDPESGVELYYLAKFYRKRMDRIPVADRYREILSAYDPKDSIRGSSGGGMNGYTVHCPYCATNSGEPSFRFTSADEEDWWHCFSCGRSGDSARLWARWEPWISKTGWRQLLNAACGEVPKAQFNPSADAADELAELTALEEVA